MSKQISLFREFSYDVTVVMVSYHTGAALWRALESVLAQEGLNELILIDNGNSPETRQRLVKKNMVEPRLKVLSGQGNIGLYQGYNLGAERAKGQYILFLSPEAVLPHDFLLRSIDEYQKHPDSWAASCKVTDASGLEKRESRRNSLTPATLVSERLGLYRLFPKLFPRLYLHKTKAPSSAIETTAPTAMCLLIESNRFKQLGGFNEAYFYAAGDMDLALRINDIGGKTLYIPSLSIIDFRTTSRSGSLFASWHTLHDTRRYFSYHFKKEHLPGTIALLNLCCFISWGTRALWRILSLPFCNKKPAIQQESERCAKFLAGYKQFEEDAIGIPKGTLYDLSQRTPILLAGAHTDIGLCILRRLLAADLEVVALYHRHIIDFEHPKLTWLQGDLMQQDCGMHNHYPRMLIYADDIRLLPDHLEHFSKLGVERIVAIASAYIFRLLTSGDKAHKLEAKSYVLAEGDVVRSSSVVNIDTTILRAGMTYGMGHDDNVSAIARFIKRFGFILLLPPANGKRQPIHCDDIAINTISLINHKASFGKTYNIVGNQTLSYHAIVEEIFKALGKKPRILKWKGLGLISSVLSPFSSLRSFNRFAIERANIDVVFDKDILPESLSIPQRNFLQHGQKDITPNS